MTPRPSPFTVTPRDSASVSRLRTRRRLLSCSITAALAAAITGLAGGAAPPATRPAAATTNRGTAQQHFDRASALYEQNNYKDALAEDDQALLLDPNFANAQVLRRVLMDKIAGGGAATGPAAVAATRNAKTLTLQQISTIRLMETGSDDMNIKGTIPRTVLDDYWNTVYVKKSNADSSTAAYNSFVNRNNFPAVAHEIRDSSNYKFIEQITVTTDPPDMIPFITTIHNLVLQNCATSECHGGDKGGNFRLIGAGMTPEVRYTNFYLLCTYNGPNGTHMIDRNEPDNSLLLQYALPKKIAKNPHPKIDVAKITSPSDQRYRQISDWIRGLAAPMPNYNITFALPGTTPTAATSAPATAPATHPR